MLKLEPLSFANWQERNFPLFDEQIQECESFYGDLCGGYRTALELEYEAYLKSESED